MGFSRGFDRRQDNQPEAQPAHQHGQHNQHQHRQASRPRKKGPATVQHGQEQARNLHQEEINTTIAVRNVKHMNKNLYSRRPSKFHQLEISPTTKK